MKFEFFPATRRACSPASRSPRFSRHSPRSRRRNRRSHRPRSDAQATQTHADNDRSTRAGRRHAQQHARQKEEAQDRQGRPRPGVQGHQDRAQEGSKFNPLIGKDQQLPDKELYDKAVDADQASGHFDVGRLDLQTLLNTYPDSQYMMRAKLAIADSWYKEGGTAALTQAEQEYKDFITFFPNAPEAAEAQMRVGDIYFRQMDKPDRDYSKATHAEEEYRPMLQQYPELPKPILDDARQKLREVQEVLADREAELGAFYATHANWPATIARYQTVVDTYPLYSHMDDVLIGLGDAYEAEAAAVRTRPSAARISRRNPLPS